MRLRVFAIFPPVQSQAAPQSLDHEGIFLPAQMVSKAVVVVNPRVSGLSQGAAAAAVVYSEVRSGSATSRAIGRSSAAWYGESSVYRLCSCRCRDTDAAE